MTQEVILTCAVTGGHANHNKHPDYPVTPKQIAQSCIDAGKAGAAVAHIHVRNPNTGERSGEPSLFGEVVARVRDSGSDVLINLTTSEGARFAPGPDDASIGGPGTTLKQPLDRLIQVEEQRPDICTLDVGTFNFGETIFVNTPSHLRAMAERIKSLGVKPEMEVFEPGHIMFAKKLIDDGLIEGSPMFQICLGIPHASPATPRMLQLMVDLLPDDANWAAFGISRWEFKVVAQSVIMGGHTRVGLEDNLYLNKGEFATNALLVEKAVRIIRELDADVVDATRAAEILGIKRR
jgi:uncharacterized protein (DUF849 family)